jgi:hypothetical protein
MLRFVIEQVVPAILKVFMPLSLGLSSKKHLFFLDYLTLMMKALQSFEGLGNDYRVPNSRRLEYSVALL